MGRRSSLIEEFLCVKTPMGLERFEDEKNSCRRPSETALTAEFRFLLGRAANQKSVVGKLQGWDNWESGGGTVPPLIQRKSW